MKGQKLLPEACKLERTYCRASQPSLPFLGLKLTFTGYLTLLVSHESKPAAFRVLALVLPSAHWPTIPERGLSLRWPRLPSALDPMAPFGRASAKCPESPKALVLARYQEQ